MNWSKVEVPMTERFICFAKLSLFLSVALACSPAAHAGFTYDGHGSPAAVGFKVPDSGFSHDSPVPGILRQDFTLPAKNIRHHNDMPGLTNLETDNNAAEGWFVEARFKMLESNDLDNERTYPLDDGFGSGIFMRNFTGTFAVNFVSDGRMIVWHDGPMKEIDPSSFGGIDGKYHTVRIQAAGGGSADVDLYVDGNNEGTYNMGGGQDLFLSVGDHSGGKKGAAKIHWDYVVNNAAIPTNNVPEPATGVLTVVGLLIGLARCRRISYCC